ncbi:Ldh family oxidoreductase [Scopulibacillus cellulosilyticus]|uniref:Ldh family oxidoreductase n=1 Tax=Scopulibacillus cellulosilyticus TaxID=2665665 RepID=A0ABW2Q1Q5_9BACL
MALFDKEQLKKFCQDILMKLNVSHENAEVVSDALVKANLEGIDSHGISRLVVYSKRLMDNRINPKPNISVKKKGTSVLNVDGDNGLGQIVSYHALNKAFEMVKETGVAAVGIRNSNHFGTASYFCQIACERHLAAIAFTNSPPGIAPWGGRRAFFGTNPIAFGFPTGNDKPIIIDLSTSVAARGKIILAAKQGESIPDGWAINEEGNMTNDPNEALQGAVLPLGGAKGSALALAVEILTGILTGASFGPHINNIYQEQSNAPANVGHFFILFDIEKFMPLEQFTQTINLLLHEMKDIPKVPGVEEIRYPGERRKRELDKRSSEGISLSKDVQKELIELGDTLNVTFPNPLVREGK